MDSSQIDLSKVISVITENPDLIMKISSLLGKGGEGREEDAQKTEETESLPINESSNTEEVTPVYSQEKALESEPKNRQTLLSAFKPYLSGERAKALDSVLTIAEVLDKIRGT